MPAGGVADAVCEDTFLSPFFSALLSISIKPLKYAQSSMMICADHCANNDVGCQLCCRADCQLPLIAIQTSPSTAPSMSRSSLPEISPFKCRLDPSRDGARAAVSPAGRITSLFILVVPSQDAEAGVGGRYLCNLVGSGSAVAVVSGILLLHIRISTGTSAPQLTDRVGAAMFQV